jgi:hypothetical protein
VCNAAPRIGHSPESKAATIDPATLAAVLVRLTDQRNKIFHEGLHLARSAGSERALMSEPITPRRHAKQFLSAEQNYEICLMIITGASHRVWPRWVPSV